VLLTGLTTAAPLPADLPAALFTDPAPNRSPPASSRGVQFRSQGALLNAQLYLPAGAGPHPLAIILHGLPGNEQNLDLAQAIRRAGWAVITYHYTGSWGSGGRFSLRVGPTDTEALLDYLSIPAHAAEWNVDPSRTVLIGHSYGGYSAARVASGTRALLGLVLIAPWDLAMDARRFANTPRNARERVAAEAFDDVDGRLGGATHRALFDDLMAHGPAMDLASLGPKLAARRVLLLTGSRDDEANRAVGFRKQIERAGASQFESEVFDADHSFNDKRIALIARILRWMERLPGAPQ
jgi:pimeloyl-ACP methyl ester carboxylesterase